VSDLWNIQPGTEKPEELVVTIHIQLTRDRRLAVPPEIVSRGTSPRYLAAAESARRAVLQGQPYNMLRDETYDAWKDITIDFDPKTMFRN
jgi:colicin import membrane protein